MEKLIWKCLWRYAPEMVRYCLETSWHEDLAQEVRIAAWEARTPKEAFRLANAIRRNFWRGIRRPPLDFDGNFQRDRDPEDRRRLSQVQTIYVAGGARMVREVFPCRGERYPREIEKLLSLCFKRARNELRNNPVRRRVKALLEDGYQWRLSKGGSLYLKKKNLVVRISDHDADLEWIGYAGVNEDINYNHHENFHHFAKSCAAH